MKTLKLVLLIASAAIVPCAYGQTALTQTSLTGAVAINATSIQVASTTGLNCSQLPQQLLYIDKEAMQCVSANGTTLTVIRGYFNSGNSAHASGAIVWAGAPQYFTVSEPAGACTSTLPVAIPQINVTTGDEFVCNTLNLWGLGTIVQGRADLGIANYTGVADVAYTAKITDQLISYTALTATRAVTLPAATGLYGKAMVIKDEAGTAGTNNITVTTTVDGSTTTFKVTTNYGVIRCYSNGTAWFSF